MMSQVKGEALQSRPSGEVGFCGAGGGHSASHCPSAGFISVCSAEAHCPRRVQAFLMLDPREVSPVPLREDYAVGCQ